MVENQLSDIILQFSDNSTIKSVKFFPSHSNSTIAKLFSEAKSDIPYTLPDKFPVDGFKMLLKYYGFGVVDVNENNAVDFLLTAFYVGDMKLFGFIKSYVDNHITIYTCKSFLEYLPNFDNKIILNLNNNICDYLVENGYEILNQSIIIIII